MTKRFTWIIALAAVACSGNPGLVLQPGETLRLDTDWELSRAGSEETYEATVPSTVAGVLEEAGYFGDDLLVGRNYAEVDKTIFDDTWIYKTQFAAPQGPHTDLVFDGLDYRADIFLNGKQIASADSTFGPFRKYVYDVTSLLKKRNNLEVRLQRAQSGDLNIGFVDWNPRPLDESMGIVRPVSLHTTGAIGVEDVFVIPDLDTETFAEADLEVRVTLRNHENRPVEGRLELDLHNPSQPLSYGAAEIPVSLAPLETRIVTVTPKEAALLHVDKPRVWWSHDLGTPELYAMAATVRTDGAVSDKKDVTFGIRKIESRMTADNYRQIILNGKDILLKGAGWTDDIFLRDTPESIDRQVRYVKDMNLNLIRFENIWGKDDTVYDRCDALGVLALVGFSCQWEWESYCGLPEVDGFGCINTPETEDLAVDYFRDQVTRLHNHASIIAWMTGSDRIPNPGLETRYMEIYNQQEYRPYINSAKNQFSTVSGWSGTKMEGPYEYVAPNYWYVDKEAGGAFGWNTETGIGANLPQLGSLRRMIPEDQLWPLSEVWDFHCTASGSMNKTRVLQRTIEGMYGGFSNLEDFVRKGHAVDYEGTRAMFEAFRVRMPKTTGIVQWMLNSAWPSLYWQLYDWYGVPTAGYYGTKKACEPVQLLFDYADRRVYAVSEDGGPAQEYRVEVKVFDINSKPAGTQDASVTLGYRDVVPVFDLRRYDGRPHYVFLTVTKPDGTLVADNFYALPAKDTEFQWRRANWYVTPAAEYADLSFVFGNKADLEMTVSGDRVTVTNKSAVIAPMVILEAKDADGNLVVPAWWSDNFFALMPGQSKTVSCRTDATDIHFELN